uniref:PDE1 N-terminal domain-containing protein n=1 Tax=Haplochromis burtoni TaxID=8153 RepID=A0A3Q2WHG4_HAPBU
MGVRGGRQDKRHTVEENQRLFINLARFLLRCLVKQLEKGEASVVELKKNLEFAACLLESLCPEENRQLGHQDDELSDIQSDSVPLEVRDWLASTFTRQRTLLLHHSEDKPHFRSIVRAVQAGIFVERFGLRHQHSNRTEHVDMWSFDVFALNDASGNHALKIVFFELLNRYNLINRFKVNSNKDSFHISFK